MSETKIFLELSEEIQQVIAENRISVSNVLDRQGIEATVGYEAPNYETEDGARSKELVTVILASGASLFAIGLAISQVLKAIYRKPYFVEYYELQEIRDRSGELILDSWGNTQFKLVKKFELIEPRAEDSERLMELKWNTQNGLVLKFRSSENQMSSPEKNSE